MTEHEWRELMGWPFDIICHKCGRSIPLEEKANFDARGCPPALPAERKP